jgi:hypothetical protein
MKPVFNFVSWYAHPSFVVAVLDRITAIKGRNNSHGDGETWERWPKPLSSYDVVNILTQVSDGVEQGFCATGHLRSLGLSLTIIEYGHVYFFRRSVLLGFALSFHFCFGRSFFIDHLSARRSRAEAP